MTEEAPPTASSVAMEDDLINYEVDDIDLGEDIDAAAPAANATTAQMTVKKSTVTVELDEITWEDDDNIGVDPGENNGDQGSGVDANAGASFDLDVTGSNPEGAKDLDVAVTVISDDAAADGDDLDIGLETQQEDGADDDNWNEYNGDDAPQDANSKSKDTAASQNEDDADESAEVIETDEDGASPDESKECPDITVTYNNEEFPLFHGQKNFDNQDGFFHDRSILSLTIDLLLGKFREELASDIDPQYEIVLQVDEMGLEYAESTEKDHCTSVSLHQIHQIFEQLAANQNPDTPRTLYMTLLVRLHPAKRLDLLIDAAYNGKGLDEVAHSYQSGHQDGGRPAAEETENADAYGDSSDVDEDASGAPDDDEQDDEDEEAQDEYIADEEEEASQGDAGGEVGGDAGGDAGGDGENDAGDAEADDYDNEDDMADMVDLDDTNDRPDQYMQTSEYVDEDDHELSTMAQPPEVMGSNAYENTDFDANQGLGDDATDAVEGDENAGLDLLDFGDDDGVVVETEQPDKGNTSASVTLNGDGDNEITYEDDGLTGASNLAAEVPPPTGGGDDGTLGEIDWRDGPDDEVAESTITPAKRPYADVEVDLGLEDEGDAKRQRS